MSRVTNTVHFLGYLSRKNMDVINHSNKVLFGKVGASRMHFYKVSGRIKNLVFTQQF